MMQFTAHLSNEAKLEISEFFAFLSDYNLDFAELKNRELAKMIFTKIPQNPYLWPYFNITGEPYRAYLYKIGKRTSYWVVYEIDEQNKKVNILRFWNTSQDPLKFETTEG